MAYYTVAHLLQGGVLNGQGPSPLGIRYDFNYRAGNLGDSEERERVCSITLGTVTGTDYQGWQHVDFMV